MNEQQLELAQKLKDEMDTELIKTIQDKVDHKAGNSKLAELQATASQVQKDAKEAQWNDITSYNQDEIPPVAMARLYAALPWGPNQTYLPLAQCLMLALVAHRRGLHPEDGDIFVLPSGKIGTSLQGAQKEAKDNGNKLSEPRFTEVTRPWPKGEVLTRKDTSVKPWREIDFDMPEEPGVKCEMTINDREVEYTAWLRPWFMGANPNWYYRMDWMLRVSAQKRCLALGTGIGVSEDIVDVDSTAPAPVKQEVKAPKETPFVGK